MKKRILSLFLILTILFISLPVETFAISLADKEKIYRANEWQLNSAQTVINWLCTDDNFAHHKHTETFASKFTMFVYGVSNVDIINKLFDNPSEYRKATKEILLSIINSNEDSMLVTTKEEVASDIIDTLLKGTADYLASDGIISDASELLQSVDSHDLQQLKYIFVDGQGQEHFNNFVLDNLTADKQEAARESVRKYFNSQKYVDDLSSITDAVSVMQDMLEIAQKSLDIFVELETYRRNDDNILHFLKYLHTDATSEHVKSVASELYISFYNSYEQNFEMAVEDIKNIVLSSATDFTMDTIIEIIENKVSVFGLFSTAAKLGVDAGKIVSDIWFNTSDTKEITASVLILDHIATDLSAYVNKCQDNFNISYDNIIINTNNAARDAGRYINAVQMLLDARKKGENRYYALKDTIYSADMLSIVHLFGGFDDTLESLEKWYTQRKADFETASNALFYYIESSQYENKYEYVFDKETFVIEDGVLIEYNGSGDSRIGTPEEIIAIGQHAFHAETLLISVSINGSPIIKSKAFDSCGDLRTVYIPKTVVEIEDNAFYNCENLTIYGYSGSAAEEYALKNSIPFVAWSVSENNSIWDGSVADGFAGGDGSVDNPYKISNGSQLAYLREQVNGGNTFSEKHFILTNDIRLNDVTNFENWETKRPSRQWSSIGSQKKYFKGKIDGKGYTVYGIYKNSLFGYSNGIITNLNIDKSYITEGCLVESIDPFVHTEEKDYYAGGIVGYNNGTIINCYNNGRILGKYCATGGIAGYNDGSITNCYNTGNVSSTYRSAGGIAGVNEENITSCYNAGTLEGYYTGGITGRNETMPGIRSNIENCYNIGDVSSVDYSAGGIAGYNAGNITNSYNNGNVSGYPAETGGIAGINHCDNDRGITNCYNAGNVLGNYLVGGIVADNSGYITNCYNVGYVSSAYGSRYESEYEGAGGISAHTEWDKYITNCFNAGNVNGNNNVGGISGRSHQEGDIENCFNTGNISGNNNVGGIVGNSNISGSSSSTRGSFIGNCYNTGNVTGNDNVGGIVGSNIKSCHIENCYNTGTIEGNKNISGILGYSENDVSCWIYNTYNIGTTIGTTNVSSIINITANQSDESDYSPYINNVYYVDNLNDSSEEKYGSPKSLDDMRKITTYNGFDISLIWDIADNVNNGFPYLKRLSYVPDYEINLSGMCELNQNGTMIVADVKNIEPQIENYIYKWYHNGEMIKSGFDNWCNVDEQDIGSSVYVSISAGQYSQGIINSKPLIVSPVTINGTLSIKKDDVTLIADVTNILPSNATFSYQWYRDDEKIEGASNSTYTLCGADVGRDITLKISGIGMFEGEIASDSINITEARFDWNGFTCVINATAVEIVGYKYDDLVLCIPVSIDGCMVTKISDSAFADAEFETILIPDTITTIGANAFEGCSNLKTINYIGTEEQWNEITVGENNDALINSEKIFEYSENIVLGGFNTVEFTGSSVDVDLWFNYAYKDCIAIIDIYDYNNGLIKSVEELIEKGAETKEITIPFEADNKGYELCISFVNNATDKIQLGDSRWSYFYAEKKMYSEGDWSYALIGENAEVLGYSGESTEITIPDTLGGYDVVKIGNYAFEYYEGSKKNIITNITIPSTVTHIGDYAFAGNQLEEITLPSSLTYIGVGAFAGTLLKSVTIPSTVTEIGNFVFDSCHNLSSILVADENVNYCSVDGNLYSKDRTQLVRYATGKTATEWAMPDDVCVVKGGALSDSKHLTTITLSKELTRIEEYAFGNGLWESITIPASVELIEDGAFSYCKNLTEIFVDGNNANYCSENGVLFSKDKGNIIQYPIGKEEISYKIPEGVTTISAEAFTGNSLQTILIPKSMQAIKNWAFEDSKYLNTVIYSGTENEYKNIDFGKGNYVLVETANIVFGYDGQPASIKTVFAGYDGDNVIVDVKFNYVERAGVLLAGIYDTSNRFVALESVPVTLNDKGATVKLKADETYKNYKVKVFYWQDLETIKPLAHSVESEIVKAVIVDDVLESKHPYDINTDETKTYTYNGECTSIDVTFSNDTIIENGWDFIYIYDANDNEIGVYTGTQLAGQTINILGNTVKIRLTSDSIITENGYRTESIIVNK